MNPLQSLVHEKYEKIATQAVEKKEAVNYLAFYVENNFQQLLDIFNEITMRRNAIPFMTDKEIIAAREKAYLKTGKLPDDTQIDPQELREDLSKLSLSANTPAEKLQEEVYDLTRKLIGELRDYTYSVGIHILAGNTPEKLEEAKAHTLQRPEAKLGWIKLNGRGICITPEGREVYENSRLALGL